jgi:uncharacterized protein YbjT (DUF2867 family)
MRAGGMPYTILRPGYFAQNERRLKPALTGLGVYPIPAGNQGLAVVDVRDIAEAAAISLIEEGHKGKTYDLVSSEMLTGPDAAATWSKLLHKEITYAGHGDLDDFEAQLRKTGSPMRNTGNSQLAGLRSSGHVPGFCRAWIQQHVGPDGPLCCLARAPTENLQQLR